MDFLVDEIVSHIFSYLSPQCILQIACVSKQFYRITCENRLWRAFLLNSYPTECHIPCFSSTEIVRDYREEFRFRNCNLVIDNVGADNWHSGIVWDSFYDERSRCILSISYDSTVRIWREKEEKGFEWEATVELQGEADSSFNPASSPIGATSALSLNEKTFLCSWEGQIQLRDLETTKKMCVFNGHRGSVCSIKPLDASGLLFVSGGSDKKVKVWDARISNKTCFEWTEEGTVLSVCVPGKEESNNMDCIVSGGRYKALSVMDWRKNTLRHSIYTGSTTHTISSSHSNYVFAGGGSRNSFGVLNKYDIQSGTMLRKLQTTGVHQAFIAGSSAINADSKICGPSGGMTVLATCAWDGSAGLFFENENCTHTEYPLPLFTKKRVSSKYRLLVKDRKAAFTSIRWCGRSRKSNQPRLLLSHFRGISVVTFTYIPKYSDEQRFANYLTDVSVDAGRSRNQDVDDDLISELVIPRPFSFVQG
ncbi:DDB1- and CUL4-associated factor 11 [Nowakowskiella sp. JEL0407]|nr:DDB1- and CUL4-associated factor 11 [Nowakowskiella sp. JEL0407]